MALRRPLTSSSLSRLISPRPLPLPRLSTIRTISTHSSIPAPHTRRPMTLPASQRPYSTNTATQTASSPPPPLLLQPKDLLSSSTSTSNPIIYLDATWFMPNLSPPRSGLQEFLQGPRLPKAQFWDLDSIASKSDLGLKHMMPDAGVFSKAAAVRGITPSTHVILYDTRGVFSSPRAAFTFAAFGHQRVSILDGGLPGWIEAGGEIEVGSLDAKVGEREGVRNEEPAEYAEPTLKSTWIRSYDEMVANARMGGRGQKVLDARPKARFDGTAPEPRQGLSSGHIPSSLSLPFPTLLSTHPLSASHTSRFPTLGSTYTKLASQTDIWRTMSRSLGDMEALEQLRHDSSSVEEERVGVTYTCGSGMTAGVLWAAGLQLGVKGAIYDESWTGWASREGSVIEKTEVEEEEE